jgi:predicted ATP-binding protein involved in virulence
MPEKTAMLTDVTIEGLRGVGRVELNFDPDRRVFVLFGANGVGKTKCLEALYQFLLMLNEDVHKYIKRTRNINILDSLRDVENEVSFNPKSFVDVSFQELKVSGKKRNEFLHQRPGPVIFIGANRPARLRNDVQAHDEKPLGNFDARRDAYFYNLLEDVRLDRLGSQGLKEGNVQAWFVKRTESVNPYKKSKDNWKAEITAVVSLLNEIDSRFDSEYIKTDDDNNVFLKVEEKERELGELSSGFASLVKLIQAIVAGYAVFTSEVDLRNVHGVVLIDEIDSHLHASWQTRIIPRLKSLFPNTTFYIATHSPLVLSQLKNKEAYLLKRDDDSVVRSQMIEAPYRRVLDDVVKMALGVDMNRLKLDSVDHDDQPEDRARLRVFLDKRQKASV